ncbi:ABC transporter ATP-binding protein [Candidatus Saccharibacteria bacterium]|nr:ABC transporter ATP-binding protein [Candidatus Saccharibacteria bacterium]
MHALIRTLLYARNLWPYYTGITIFALLMSLSALAAPYIIKLATDAVVAVIEGKPADYTYIIWLAVALLLADVANTLFTNWGGYLGDVMAAKMKKQLSERYYHHLLRLPQSYYDQELTGTIINRLNRTIFEVTQFMNMFANNFFSMIMTIVIVLVVLLAYSWEIALLVFIVYPVFLWLTTLTSRSWQRYQDKKNHETDVASGRFAEVIAQIKVVKSFVQERLELQHFERHYQQTVEVTYRQSRQWHNYDILRRLVLNAIFFVIFGYVFIKTLGREFTVGEMIFIIQLVSMVRIPIFSMSFIVDQTQRAMAGCKDYFKVMSLKPAIDDASNAPALDIARGQIEYRGVSFAYKTDEPVLRDVSFTVEPGTKVALVGESGEGKTTLTNLLLRLYSPTDGTIAIDGTDIASVRQRSLRDKIAVVFQDPALFSGTIRENIAYALPHATDEQVVAAAKAANAHDFINKLKGGYEAEIGERGLKLSGGQKQRLAIARAILKDAPILILDEATSSLDSRAEAQVQEALERLMKRRTTLIIAHRLSTIAHVDKIVTIKKGTVDEIGTPAELAGTGGIYGQLLELQMGTSEKAKKQLKAYEIAA